MKLKTFYAVTVAISLSACATGYTSKNSHGGKTENASYIVKMASNSASDHVVLIPAQTSSTTEAKVITKADTPAVIQPTPASLEIDTAKTKATTTVSKHKYKTLEYGAHKPLVCKNPVLSEGKLKGRPNLQVMWENYLYPRPEGIWSEIGGYVEINGNLPHDQGRWTNACAIRLSHMLLKAGHRIPQRYGITSSAANKDQYIYRLSDMEDYLIEILGKPDHVMKGESTQWYNLPNVPGIVLIDFPGHNSFTGHTTVWNGAGTVDGSDTVGDKLLFWELPCFIPEDRIEDEPEILVGELEPSITALP